MKPIRVVALALSLSVSSLSAISQQTPTESANQADLAFLTLVDSAHYAQSWRATAAVFQAQVTEAQWEQAMASARAPLGKLLERKLQDATFTKTLPGAPDGSYVVAHFQSSFEHKQSAIETVVTSMEKDGSWHVSGYFIK